ncbi:MAG: sugar transferase [Anaerolineae bacterium]|nr:sugar transferase [Anaerolineae bacterium]
MMRHYSLRYLLFLYAMDVLMVCGALALSSALRIRLEFGKPGAPEAFFNPLILYVIASIIWLFAFSRSNVYGPRHSPQIWGELWNILIGHTIASFIFFGILYLVYRDFSRVQAGYFIVIALIGLIVYRLAGRLFYQRYGQSISDTRRVLVVGTDSSAVNIADTVKQYDWAGLSFAGYVSDQTHVTLLAKAQDGDVTPSEETLPSPIVGVIDDLPALVSQYQVNEVVIPLKWFDSETSEQISNIMRALDAHAVNIRLAPDYSDLAYFQASAEDFSGIPLIGVRERVLSPAQRIFKRLFDILFSGAALTLMSPIFLLITVAVRLDSRGPIIYRQKRVGEYGKLFTMLKFRSMYEDAGNPSSEYSKQRLDPRVTRVGRILRRTSLDELPQFINILRGDMSIVGPRPEMPGLVSRYDWWQRKRFEVPQGLTGWWQINGRSDKPMHMHTEDDLFYIRNYSLWLDIQICFRTVFAIIAGKGAF